jgi:hypothetical protein
LPAATNASLGSEKIRHRPLGRCTRTAGPWTVGILFNRIWCVGGANDRDDVNSTYLQPFLNYNLGGGLSAGVSVEPSANWEADEAWTAPLLSNVSKVHVARQVTGQFRAGCRPNDRQSGGWRQLAIPFSRNLSLFPVT